MSRAQVGCQGMISRQLVEKEECSDIFLKAMKDKGVEFDKPYLIEAFPGGSEDWCVIQGTSGRMGIRLSCIVPYNNIPQDTEERKRVGRRVLCDMFLSPERYSKYLAVLNETS